MHRVLKRPQLLVAALPCLTPVLGLAADKSASALKAALCRSYAATQPSRTPDGSLGFPVQQPPSRLTLLFPFSKADVQVITGGYETVKVKVCCNTELSLASSFSARLYC